MVQHVKCFKLENQNPFIEFTLHDSSSVISIKKIVIDTLLDKKDDEWFHDLYKMNIFLEFTGNGHGIHPIDMPAFTFMSVHPVPRRPVYIFDNDFIIPEYNSRNESQSDFCKEVKIEMKPIRGRLADNLSLTFFYETTPGVSPKDLARLC